LHAIIDAQELFLADADGSGEPVLIHRSAGYIGAGAWSSDGEKIAFAVGDASRSSIFVAAPPEPAAEPLADAGTTGPLLWSPDNRRIAYKEFLSTSDTGSVTAISVLDIDTGKARNLLNGGEDLGLAGWFPGSAELLVTQSGQLLKADASSGTTSIIASGFFALTADRVSLSPDGTRVAVGAEKACALRLVNVEDGAAEDLVSGPCSIYGIAWSPDGAEIAYGVYETASGVSEGESGTYVVEVGTGEVRRLTTSGVTRGEYFEWLADGSGLAIQRCYEGCFEAALVPAAGGEERPLTVLDRLFESFGGFASDARRYVHSHGPLTVESLDGQVHVELAAADDEMAYTNLSWAPEGERVAYVRTQSQATRRYAIDARTGEVTDQRAPAYQEKASPDGKLIAYTKPKTEGEAAFHLWLANPDGSDERELASEDVTSFTWSPDSRSIAYSSFERMKAAIVDVATAGERELPLAEGNYQVASWSPDGAGLALVRTAAFPHADLVVFDIAEQSSAIVATAIDSPSAALPAWSPDSRMLLYQNRDSAGKAHLAVVDTSTGEPTQLTDGDYQDGGARWSPDGKSIAFWRQLTAGSPWEEALYVVAVNTGEEVELARFTVGSGSLSNIPVWSPDGLRIAAYSPANTDPGIYVVDADGSGLTLVARARTGGRGYEHLSWSADGRRILITSVYQGL